MTEANSRRGRPTAVELRVTRALRGFTTESELYVAASRANIAPPTSRAWSVISTTTERRSCGWGARRTWPRCSSRSSMAEVAGALRRRAELS